MSRLRLGASCFFIFNFMITAGHAAVLVDMSNITTGVGTGANGANVSVIAANSTTYGFTDNAASNTFALADDFTLTQNSTVSAVTFYAYSTSTYPSPPTSPFTGLSVKLWSGQPGVTGSTILATSTTLSSTAWTGVYRVTSTALTSAQRPVMSLKASFPSVVLAPGTYWASFAVTAITAPGSSSSIFTPPMMNTDGSMPAGNGIQSSDGGTTWAAVTDTTTAATSTFPLLIEGSVAPATTTTTLATACQTTFTQGQPFTVGAAVNGSSATGTVSFFVNSAGISGCQNVALNASTAACTTTALTPGTDSLTASYSGDANNAASQSSPLIVTVLDPTDTLFRDNFETIPETCPVE